MNIVYYISILLVFCLMPAAVLWLCRKVSLLGKIGPIMVLYAIGMGIANLPFLPREQLASVQDILPNALIPLAIPMMLYGCRFSTREAGLQVKIVLSGMFSVALAVTAGYLCFGDNLPDGARIGGIITGMYTGGTVNAAALQAVFGIDSETFVLVNSYDIIISFLYFVFLFAFGIKMFRKLFGGSRHPEQIKMEEGNSQETAVKIAENGSEQNQIESYRRMATKEGLAQLGKVLALTVVLVGISAGVALLCPSNWFMMVFILLITTLGVACSFIPKVQKFDLSYDAGMYLIYIFSITIASMADFSKLSLESGIGLFGFMTLAVFISLALHALFCRLMKVDADSMVISSVAFINSPPFVPMVSAAMKNRNALVTGLAAGIVGYAVGNHFGILLSWILGNLI
ncbi:MAG: DUF819 family protein [Bacteroidales bacterium]|nr:DUF819 family protein [Bacteroidales bacterium]